MSGIPALTPVRRFLLLVRHAPLNAMCSNPFTTVPLTSRTLLFCYAVVYVSRKRSSSTSSRPRQKRVRVATDDGNEGNSSEDGPAPDSTSTPMDTSADGDDNSPTLAGVADGAVGSAEDDSAKEGPHTRTSTSADSEDNSHPLAGIESTRGPAAECGNTDADGGSDTATITMTSAAAAMTDQPSDVSSAHPSGDGDTPNAGAAGATSRPPLRVSTSGGAALNTHLTAEEESLVRGEWPDAEDVMMYGRGSHLPITSGAWCIRPAPDTFIPGPRVRIDPIMYVCVCVRVCVCVYV